MITPVELPPEPDQSIEQRLMECGLDVDGFTVSYEDALQGGHLVVVLPAPGATEGQFPCIREAAGQGIVLFQDPAMSEAYSGYEAELFRPEMLERATADLSARGLLNGFPDRESFPSLDLYAEALEAHGGVPPRTGLTVDGGSIVFDPPRDEAYDEERYLNLIAVIIYAVARGDFQSFGFIGNGLAVEPD